MSLLGLDSSRPLQRLVITALLLTLMILVQLPTNDLVSGLACPANCDEVEVAPGKYDLQLGADFPGLGSVKLSYPNSTILTDSIGDLLFTVTLRPPKSNLIINGITEASFYRSVDIYIPPDFTNLATNKFWTSFSNDYDPNSIALSKLSSTDQIGPGWWRVSIKNLVVTSNLTLASSSSTLTAHRVFVTNQSQYIRLFRVTSPLTAGRYFFKVFINGTMIDASRFPTIVVEASRNPAYISGTLRDIGNLDPTKAGEPIELPIGFGARILATGIDYLGRDVSAQAFINSTAVGRYTLFGVAPGTYNITAYAAGFRPSIHPFRVSVVATQSLEGVDVFMPHSVNITGTVRSTTGDNEPIEWGVLYGFGGNPISRSIVIRVFSLDGASVTSTPAPYGPSLFADPTSTSFDFSIQKELGFDGRIPQKYANYTSGLTAGDYLLRAYVASYVQYDEVRIHVANETKTTYSEIRLVRGGFINVTVHFKDLNSTLIGTPTSIPGTLSVQVFDQAGNMRGSNTTFVPAGSTNATLEVQGTSEARSFGITGLLPPNSGLLPGIYHVYARFTSSPSFTGFANVGIRDLYYQLEDYTVTVGLSTKLTVNNAAMISFSIFRGGGILLSLYSVDPENPVVLRPWGFPGAVITLKIIDRVGNIYRANATQLPDTPRIEFFYSGLLTDNYEIAVGTVGYDQALVTKLHVVLGGNSDAAVWMRQDPLINMTLVFKTEGLLTTIDSTAPYAQPINHLDSTPVRIEIYDMLGNFAAAEIAYIPNRTGSSATTSASFLLAGFNRYFGDPKMIWSGFYDATDASRQGEAGISPGTYMIVVWLDGYYQNGQAVVRLEKRGNASLVVSMERASRISGIIAGPDLYDEGRPLSWVVVDLEPGNYTTFTLDGFYQVWVPSGTYGIGFSAPGYSRQTMSIVVPAGSDLWFDIWLNYG